MADTTLQILISAVDEATAQLQNVANGLDAAGQKALTAQQQLEKMGQAMQTAGIYMAGAGAVLDAGLALVIDDASKEESAHARLQATIEALVGSANKAKDAHAGLGTQIKFVQDKVANTEAEIAKLSGAHVKSAEDAAKNQAQIAVLTDALNKERESLQILKNAQDLAGQSASDIEAKFNGAAQAAIGLGFNVNDSLGSIQQLFAVTKSVPDALAAFATAQDLARARGEDLQTATNQVSQGINGMGKSLQLAGINIKDGLSGMAAVQAIADLYGGTAQKQVATFAVQMQILTARFDDAAAKIGDALLPYLTKLIEIVTPIIQKIGNWIEQHPKLTLAIAAFVATLAVLLTVGGALLLFLGTLLVVFGGMAAPILGAGAAIALLIAGLAAAAVAIVTHWEPIKTFFKNLWDDIVAIFKAAVSVIMPIVQPLIDAVGKVGSIAGGIGSAIGRAGGAVGNFVMQHLASGGIVTGPTFAMVGESGPEAVIPLSLLGGGMAGGGSYGGGGITVNVNNPMLLDRNAAVSIANVIAKVLNQQLKLKNYS